MDRSELTIFIAAALLAAVLLGWILRWIFSSFGEGSGPRSMKRTANLVARLHETEEERDRALEEIRLLKDGYSQEVARLNGELDLVKNSFENAQAQVEEMRAAYSQVLAESTGTGQS